MMCIPSIYSNLKASRPDLEDVSVLTDLNWKQDNKCFSLSRLHFKEWKPVKLPASTIYGAGRGSVRFSMW